MTEAMSRREIEDVLSSIRRLVSQDQPRQDHTAPEHDGSAAPGKLILTSELRVSDDPAEPESDLPAGINDAQNGESNGAQGAFTANAQTDDATGDSEAAGPTATDDTPSAIHVLRAMNQRDADQKTATAAVDDATRPDSSALPPDADGDLVLEATLARLERVLSEQKTQSQADGDHSHSVTPDTLRPAPDAHAGDLTDPQQTAASSDDPVIDEAMLYQIVANIVRQELQGELGERITRNIRKLVRAEVARELQLRKP
ncbi:hypothetical protein [Roseinatronobacter sp. S2]|uniref:hypothetical protein n=1 Tax=Roseinatronobacter sp. S2 TaxID=3035471 RepID=UPI00240F4322|nr:hypothetical protein [Roseinatronobacter sp. S2]WFE76144.1 hypothetical protein P8S53_07010 [Roseinatronobacter sp. S2]